MIKRIEYFAMFMVPINDRDKSVRIMLKWAALSVMNSQLRKVRGGRCDRWKPSTRIMKLIQEIWKLNYLLSSCQ